MWDLKWIDGIEGLCESFGGQRKSQHFQQLSPTFLKVSSSSSQSHMLVMLPPYCLILLKPFFFSPEATIQTTHWMEGESVGYATGHREQVQQVRPETRVWFLIPINEKQWGTHLMGYQSHLNLQLTATDMVCIKQLCRVAWCLSQLFVWHPL